MKSEKLTRQKKQKIYQRKYQKTAKGKATQKRYEQTKKGQAARQAALKRFYVRNPNYLKAKHAVSNAIRDGKMPRPDTLKCSCGEQAKQYHHHKGYASKHWLDAIPICTECHPKCNKETDELA